MVSIAIALAARGVKLALESLRRWLLCLAGYAKSSHTLVEARSRHWQKQQQAILTSLIFGRVTMSGGAGTSGLVKGESYEWKESNVS